MKKMKLKRNIYPSIENLIWKIYLKIFLFSFENFEDNEDLIEGHNKNRSSYKLAHNDFSHWVSLSSSLYLLELNLNLI